MCLPYRYRYCSPTRGSFLSGRLPHHDHQSNPGGSSPFEPNLNMTLLPAKLRAAGYRTAMRGKWHYGFASPRSLPEARGFEDSAGYLQGACDHTTEVTGCAVDSWRAAPGGGGGGGGGPDRRNGTGYDSWRHAADMVAIIHRQAADPRPLFLYAALHVVHNPIEAPPEIVARYNASQPQWCAKKREIAAMATVADNVTAQLVAALRAEGMWGSTVLVFSSDNGGDSGCSSCFPLRGRKRTYFEGGVRVPALLASPLLPEPRRGGRVEAAFLHVSDWYATFVYLAGLAGADNPRDRGPGRFEADGRNLWPYLADPAGATPAPAHTNNVLVLGFNYSTLAWSRPGYGAPSGALIEPATGYKLVVGSQRAEPDTLQWDPADYPCSKTADGVDCTPHCLYNVLQDPSERHELSGAPGGAAPPEHQRALERLLAAYAAVGAAAGMPNPIDARWNEQGTPYDPAACDVASRSGYWQPWLP